MEEEEVKSLPINITRLRNPARRLPGLRPYSPNREEDLESSGSSHLRISSRKGGVDGEGMSDLEKSKGVSDGNEHDSAYPFPVMPQKNGSIISSVEQNIPHVAEQEEERNLA